MADVQPINKEFAAEIGGVDLSQSPSSSSSADTIQAIQDAFGRFGVIVIRDQKLTPAQLSDFSKNFGPLHVHHLAENTIPDHPEVRVLSNVKKKGRYIGQYRGGHYWHTDLIFCEKIGHATILHGVQCPPEGADTLVCDMRGAFEAMPKELQDKIDGKVAHHDHAYRYNILYPERPPLTPEQAAKVPPVDHPMVCFHPQSGRKSILLTVPTIRTLGDLNEDDTAKLMNEVEAFCTQPQFIYAHKWRDGDVVMWDNLCTMHSATPFDEKYDRIINRTQTVYEDRPRAA